MTDLLVLDLGLPPFNGWDVGGLTGKLGPVCERNFRYCVLYICICMYTLIFGMLISVNYFVLIYINVRESSTAIR